MNTPRHLLRLLALLLLVSTVTACTTEPPADEGRAAIRVATYNIEDIWTRDLMDADQPRLRAAAAQIQSVRPDILLVNEMTYDQPGDPGYETAGDGEPGLNAQRFADTFLARAQAPDLEPIRYRAFTAPTNTGVASGFDLNNDGRVVRAVPPSPDGTETGQPAAQTAEGQAYGTDAWGFGVFPGQYGMALFVREDLEILRDSVRTFRLLPWQDLPDHRMPEGWYSDEEAAAVRLSSKSHWDVPVRLPDGTVVHVLASHPTPPAFDGPEERNVRRNYDEIRFWADYLRDAAYVVDDSSHAGGLRAEAPFVILGDLNADPDEGKPETRQAIQQLLQHPRVNPAAPPLPDSAGVEAFPELDPDDTARWGRRVDYVLPSENLDVLDSRIVRPSDTSTVQASDHFMVWVDVAPGR